MSIDVGGVRLVVDPILPLLVAWSFELRGGAGSEPQLTSPPLSPHPGPHPSPVPIQLSSDVDQFSGFQPVLSRSSTPSPKVAPLSFRHSESFPLLLDFHSVSEPQEDEEDADTPQEVDPDGDLGDSPADARFFRALPQATALALDESTCELGEVEGTHASRLKSSSEWEERLSGLLEYL
jgi:hypothetical protein